MISISLQDDSMPLKKQVSTVSNGDLIFFTIIALITDQFPLICGHLEIIDHHQCFFSTGA